MIYHALVSLLTSPIILLKKLTANITKIRVASTQYQVVNTLDDPSMMMVIMKEIVALNNRRIPNLYRFCVSEEKAREMTLHEMEHHSDDMDGPRQ